MTDKRVVKATLILASLILLVAWLCMLLWGGDGAFTQWGRVGWVVVCALTLVVLLREGE